jgi:hypothetical protein
MRVLLLLLLMPLFLVACAADDAQDEPSLQGPALVMWYTDN